MGGKSVGYLQSVALERDLNLGPPDYASGASNHQATPPPQLLVYFKRAGHQISSNMEILVGGWVCKCYVVYTTQILLNVLHVFVGYRLAEFLLTSIQLIFWLFPSFSRPVSLIECFTLTINAKREYLFVSLRNLIADINLFKGS